MGYKLDSIQQDCYPNTTVLINKLDITDEKLLAETESVFASFKAAQLIEQPLKSDFSFDDYKALHSYLFSDLYEWAGTVRKIDMSKMTTRFTACDRIEEQGQRIFSRLHSMDYFRGLARAELVAEVADLYHTLNLLHPFREGNGRTQRVFFTQLIRAAGYDIDYSELNSELLMIGSIQAASGVMDNLVTFFDENIK